MAWLDNQLSGRMCKQPVPLLTSQMELKINIPSIINTTELKLKPLLKHFKYPFLAQPNTLPMIISALLTPFYKEKLLRVLRDHHLSIGWTIPDI